MELNIQTPKSHSYRLIAVASEKLNRSVYDYKTLECKDKVFKVINHIKVFRNNPFPSALFLLATGMNVDSSIWENYKKSEFIVLFVVEEVKCG